MIEDRDENNDLSSSALGGDRGPSHPGTGADSASIENLEYDYQKLSNRIFLL
jgi:hypothetical protein